MHGPIQVLDTHGTGTKHIVRHSQRSGIRWSWVAEFACTIISSWHLMPLISRTPFHGFSQRKYPSIPHHTSLIRKLVGGLPNAQS